MEQFFVESVESHIKEVPIWRLCFVVSQGNKQITSWQI